MLNEWLIHNSKYFGIAGCLIILLGVIISAITYSGRKRERYSPLNHFVSELGELGVARNARLFNLGLILGGLLFIPFMVGLGLKFDSLWGKLGILAGVWASISAMHIGFFPMDYQDPHFKSATSFFQGGVVTMLTFGLAIHLQPEGQLFIPLAANLMSGLNLLVYASYLLLFSRLWGKDPNFDSFLPNSKQERPKFWFLTLLEWFLYSFTVLWFLMMALLM
jgi:hypothetical membrane protein